MSLRSTPQQAQLKTLSGLVASKPKWQQWIASSLDLIFPPRCAGCDRVDYTWCPDCQQALKRSALEPRLQRTSENLKIVSTGEHRGLLAQAIHVFKYQNTPELYAILSQRLYQCLRKWDIQPDLLIPVPLHAKRQHERGYNQAALLTAGLSKRAGVPYHLDLLQRVIDTPSQVGLSEQERSRNVQNAFHAENVSGLTIMLIDDVMTTGATLNQCALCLKQAGASQIYGLTVTYA